MCVTNKVNCNNKHIFLFFIIVFSCLNIKKLIYNESKERRGTISNMPASYSLTTVTATSTKNTTDTASYSITANFNTNRTDLVRIKRWTLTKNSDGIGTANFSPVSDNTKISLHFNIRETTTVINSNSGGWGAEIFVSDIHTLPNPSTIYISFHAIDGWKIEYVVSGVSKVVTLPNRLDILSVDSLNNSPFSQWTPSNMMSISNPSIIEKNVTLSYSVPANNYCTITNSGTVTPTGSSQSVGNSVVVTATLAGDGISSALTATHTISFLKTPVYTGGISSYELFYSNIGNTYTPSSLPNASSFTPNLVSPSFTYSISYLSNQTYAAANVPVATISNTYSPGSNIVGTGMCYYTITAPANVSAFLDTVTANFHFLTVRPGYIIGPNVDLTDAVIQNYNLDGINFSSCNLTNAKIINCLLANVNFTNAVFTNATFTYNTIQSTTNFNGASFTGLVSNDNNGTTTNISSSWEIKGGKIVASGTVYFSLFFNLETPSNTIPSGDGYKIVTNGLMVNGVIESATPTSNNFIIKNTDTRYQITQVGPGALYIFELIHRSSDNRIYIRGINASTNTVIALPNTESNTFAASYKFETLPIGPGPSGYVISGSYLFGSNMNLAGTYFDNAVNPKPDLTGLTLNNIFFPVTGTTINGWNLSNTKFNNGTFVNVFFSDCNCSSTDFSGSTLDNASFKITYTSKNVALTNIATLQNAKFTNYTT